MTRFATAAVAAIALASSPVGAASAPAPAVSLDDFQCMVRTMYMGGAAENSAAKATDAAAQEKARGVAAQGYEAASYFMGRLTLSKGVIISKARFESELAGLSQLQPDTLASQVAICSNRATNERAAFITPLSSK